MRANEQNTHVLRRIQTLVGLMCWLAAKQTRSPFRRRLARSASRPIVRRSCESKSARPSSRESRSPRSTLSTTGASAGSCRPPDRPRSEEHTSELQSHHDLVCRLLLEKKKKKQKARKIGKQTNTKQYKNI